MLDVSTTGPPTGIAGVYQCLDPWNQTMRESGSLCGDDIITVSQNGTATCARGQANVEEETEFKGFLDLIKDLWIY